MSTKSRILSTLVGFVVYFLLGWLLYGIVLMEFFQANSGGASNVMRSDDAMVWWALVLGNISFVYLLVYVFGNWASISTFKGGVKGGATIGLILALGYGLTTYATTNISSLTGALTDVVVATVMMGITGGVVGWMLGRES